MAEAVFRAEKYANDAFSFVISNLKRNRVERQAKTFFWGAVNLNEIDNTFSEIRNCDLQEENSLEKKDPVFLKRKKTVVCQKNEKFSRVFQQFDTSLTSSKVLEEDNYESTDFDDEVISSRNILCEDQKLRSIEQTKEKSFPKLMNKKAPNKEICASQTDNLYTSKFASNSGYAASVKGNFCMKNQNIDERISDCFVLGKTSENMRKMIPHEQKNEKLEHTYQEAEPVLESKNNLLLNRSKFEDWCRIRQESLSKASVNKSDTRSSCALKKTDNELNRPVKKHPKKNSNGREQSDTKIKVPKYVKDTAVNKCDEAASLKIQPSSVKKKDSAVAENTRLCVKVTDEKSGKNFEIISDAKISTVKRMFPKVSAVIPDIDSGGRKLSYSADAVNIILRFIFRCPLNMKEMPPLLTGMEVIAASKSWEVSKFQDMFKDEFLKQVLNPENASMALAHASHFDLQEICEHVKSNFPVKIVNDYKKRDKSCFVSISTYIEPSIICIPFSPTGKDFTKSFDRPISNKFTFEAYSCGYILLGFRIELNEEHLSKSVNSDECLEIDYSVRNVSKNERAYNGTEKKPLRPINVINFKENLILNPHEVGEVVVKTEIKPYLCSEHKEETIKHGRKFALTVESSQSESRKRDSTDLKLFFIRGLLYHEM